MAPPPTVKNYKTIAACGLNVIFLDGNDTSNPAIAKRSVLAAEKAGVGVFFGSGNKLDSPVLFENKFAENKAVAGINVYDEPFLSQYEDIASVSGGVKNAYGGNAFYLNLLPSYAAENAIGKDHAAYIEKYAALIKSVEESGWLSIDHYPLEVEENGGYRLSANWLKDVETVADTAEKYGLRAHFFLQSMAYGGEISRLHDRTPAIEDIRLQIYVYLAYGARGFTHFCYQSPVSREFNERQTGLVKNGGKTERWALVKKVHEEIFSFESEYLGMQRRGTVKFVGEGKSGKAFEGLGAYGLADSEIIKTLRSNANLLIGVFSGKNGKEGYVFTNFADTSEGVTAKFTVFLKKSASLTVYVKGKKRERKVAGRISFTLEKGEGIFVTAKTV